MNTRKTLLLAVLLGVAVLYLTKVSLPGREFEAGQKMALASLKASDIQSLEVVQNPDGADQQGKRYVLTHKSKPTSSGANSADDSKVKRGDSDNDDGLWEMPAIRGAVLDDSVVSQMITGLSTLAVEGPVSDKDAYADLSGYGLSKPELTMVVHEVGGKDTEIAFGKKNQYLLKRYVKISGRSGIYLAEDASFEALNKSSTDVRSKKPFKFYSKDVREVLLNSFQGRVRLQQPAVGEWRIVEPTMYRASNEDVEAFLRALQDITVSEYIDGEYENRSKYGFSLPRVNVTIDFREGITPRQASFFLANANATSGGTQTLYATLSTSDTIFKLANDPSPALAKRVDDLRFKRVIDIEAASMQKVVATTAGGDPVTIIPSGVSWTVNGKEGDPIFVDQLLRDMSSLKAVSFPTDVPPDAFETPFLFIQITPKGGEAKGVTITVGKEFAGQAGDTLRYVKVSTGETVYAIRDVEAKRIIPHEESLVPTPAPTTAAGK